MNGSGNRTGGNVIRPGFMQVLFDLCIAMPHDHGIVDLRLQPGLTGSSGKIDERQRYPAAGNLTHATIMKGGSDEEDFLGCSCSFYWKISLDIFGGEQIRGTGKGSDSD